MRKVIYDNDIISIDSGVFFGRGVFETILVKTMPIFLEEHIQRLNKSIIELELGELIAIEDVINFIKQHNIKNKALKITVTEKNLIYSLREIKSLLLTHLILHHVAVSSPTRSVSVLLGPFSHGL